MNNKQGWGWPANSRKAHYFVDGKSLCSKWMYSGELKQGNDKSSDNCSICRKKFEKAMKVHLAGWRLNASESILVTTYKARVELCQFCCKNRLPALMVLLLESEAVVRCIHLFAKQALEDDLLVKYALETKP